ncbi:MAG: redoxin domain-containing protein [Gammaproteobacteria bacterium]|nr:redoxin domain-containing protein [Gammaproteobacteria bacterium]
MNKLTVVTLISLLSIGTGSIEAADLALEQWEKDRFKELDLNNDGGLDNVEVRGTNREWMTKSGYSEEKQIKLTNEKFKKFDTNKDNKVSIEEFVTLNRKENARVKAEKAKTEKVKTPVIKNTEYKLAPTNYLGKDREGNKVNLDELKGKIVVISFWISWCKPCKTELAILENLQNKIGKNLIKVVAINYKDSRSSYIKMKNQLSDFNITLTHDKFEKISNKFGVESAPHLFIIGKDGKIIFDRAKYKETPVNDIVDVIKKELVRE